MPPIEQKVEKVKALIAKYLGIPQESWTDEFKQQVSQDLQALFED